MVALIDKIAGLKSLKSLKGLKSGFGGRFLTFLLVLALAFSMSGVAPGVSAFAEEGGTGGAGGEPLSKPLVKLIIHSQSKVYGESDPELTATVEPPVPDGTLDYTLYRTQGEAVADYSIRVLLGDNPDYRVEVENGTLNIQKAPLTIYSGSGIFAYNGGQQTNGLITIEGLKWDDTYEGVEATGSILGAGSIENEIDESKAVYTSEWGYDIRDNYEVHHEPGTLTVMPSGIHVDLTAAGFAGFNRVYGDGDPSLASIRASIQERVNEQLAMQNLPANSVEVTVTGREPGEALATPYAYELGYRLNGITPGDFAEGSEIRIAADLTITPRPIVLFARSAGKVYDGAALTDAGYTLMGALAQGEQLLGVAVTGSQQSAGRSANVVSGARVTKTVDGVAVDMTRNYDIIYVNGELLVLPAQLIATVANMRLTEGERAPTDFTTSITGFVRGENIGVLTGAPVYTTTYTSRALAGESHLVNLSGFRSGNYSILYVPGTISVIAGEGAAGGSATPTTPADPAPPAAGTPVAAGAGVAGVVGVAQEDPLTPGAVADPSATTIEDEPTPLAEGSGGAIVDNSLTEIGDDSASLVGGVSWALVNLILCALGLLMAAFSIIVSFVEGKKEKGRNADLVQGRHSGYDREQYVGRIRGRRAGLTPWDVMGLVAALASLLLFVVTQNVGNPMSWIDSWTIPHLLIFLVQVAFFVPNRIASAIRL